MSSAVIDFPKESLPPRTTSRNLVTSTHGRVHYFQQQVRGGTNKNFKLQIEPVTYWPTRLRSSDHFYLLPCEKLLGFSGRKNNVILAARTRDWNRRVRQKISILKNPNLKRFTICKTH